MLWVLLDKTANQATPFSSGDEKQLREAALIRRVNEGERELFYDLVRPYERNIYLAAFSMVKNEADAEDLAQEAVLKALRALPGFRGEAKFSTWIISIVLNEGRMRLRRDRLASFQSIDEKPETNDGGDYTPAFLTDWREIPSEALERSEIRQILHEAIASLPEAYRQVLIMRDIEEMSIQETAQALGLTEGTVKIRLFRARMMLQKALAPRLQSPSVGLYERMREFTKKWF
jgi:RNA polymerase sigma-70 factor, ECF subfamily